MTLILNCSSLPFSLTVSSFLDSNTISTLQNSAPHCSLPLIALCLCFQNMTYPCSFTYSYVFILQHSSQGCLPCWLLFFWNLTFPFTPVCVFTPMSFPQQSYQPYSNKSAGRCLKHSWRQDWVDRGKFCEVSSADLWRSSYVLRLMHHV